MVGTCSRFRVEQLPVATVQQPPQPQQQQSAPDVSSTAQQAAGSNGIGTAVTNGPDVPPNALSFTAATAGAANGLHSATAPTSTLLPPATAIQPPRPGIAKPLPVSSVPTAAKTLMIFDGCPLPLGCTVLLWGASAAELTKLKRIVKFGVLAAYHQGLECAFLAEELALSTAALAAPGRGPENF